MVRYVVALLLLSVCACVGCRDNELEAHCRKWCNVYPGFVTATDQVSIITQRNGKFVCRCKGTLEIPLKLGDPTELSKHD